MLGDQSEWTAYANPPRLGLSLRRPDQPPAPIGVLEDLVGHYRFRYVEGLDAVTDFRPLIGFPDLRKTYLSEKLFPFFSQRVLQPDRPDYVEYVELLSLPVTASVWQLLARSGGTRKGDPYELVAEPDVDASGYSSCTFFVRGLRFAPRGVEATGERVADLRQGETLALFAQTTNAVNPNAWQVCDVHGFPLGWVPDTLIPWVQASKAAPAAVVVATNPAPAPWHLRLLTSVDVVVTPGFRLLDQGAWRLSGKFDARSGAGVGTGRSTG